jgi:phosphoribosyl 1,2-cyclic phosphodiesterase
MIVAPLGSGSAGNSYYFESDGTGILVDAGLGPRDTHKRLQQVGRGLETVSAIVITHEHYDHIRGAESIAKKWDIPVYLTAGTLDASSLNRDLVRTVVFENNSSFRIGELEVQARRTAHDAADPACFVVEGVDGTRVGIASDLGSVDAAVLRHLSNCDGLFFESNHDVDMLRMGSYPWHLKRRILSRVGHLSNDDAMHAVQRLLCSELQTLCLIHLSEKNNHESIVRDMASTLLKRAGARTQLQIARQSEPLGAFAIARRGGFGVTAVPKQMSLFAV